MSDEEAQDLLEMTAAKLAEHFDAVEIMVSLQNGEDTRCFEQGAGNYYARLGMAQEFLGNDRAGAIAQHIVEELDGR